MSVSRETLERLKTYEVMLRDWQTRMNLVSNNSLEQAWERHFEDSLQLLPLIPEGVKTLYDLGSGAGFPGLIFALARPDIKVHLVESTQKKCAFLNAVSHETGAGAIIHAERIESVAANKKLPVPDMVTARALANLDKLLTLCAPWIKANPKLVLLFPKGASWREEVDSARENWSFDLEDHPSQTDPAARILVITNVQR